MLTFVTTQGDSQTLIAAIIDGPISSQTRGGVVPRRIADPDIGIGWVEENRCNLIGAIMHPNLYLV